MRAAQRKFFRFLSLCLYFTILAVFISGCLRGTPSKNPPIHLVPDMDNQPKYKAQARGDFFADGAAMRSPIPGTVPQGKLYQITPFYDDKSNEYQITAEERIPVSLPLLKRGQERYNIYCTPCHSPVGDGQGIVVMRGYTPPPTFHSDRMRGLTDEYISNVIANGIRNMPSYGHQIAEQDRWAIVAYVRALQRAQNATLQDVPEQLRDKLK